MYLSWNRIKTKWDRLVDSLRPKNNLKKNEDKKVECVKCKGSYLIRVDKNKWKIELNENFKGILSVRIAKLFNKMVKTSIKKDTERLLLFSLYTYAQGRWM